MLKLQGSHAIANGQLADIYMRRKQPLMAVRHLENVLMRIKLRDAHPNYKKEPMAPGELSYLHMTTAKVGITGQ